MDPNYAFYLYLEDLKNKSFRQLSSAKMTGLFWPKFYYSWFYANERSYYDLLDLRQKIGKNVTQAEINSYNEIRVRDQVKLGANKPTHSLRPEEKKAKGQG